MKIATFLFPENIMRLVTIFICAILILGEPLRTEAINCRTALIQVRDGLSPNVNGSKRSVEAGRTQFPVVTLIALGAFLGLAFGPLGWILYKDHKKNKAKTDSENEVLKHIQKKGVSSGAPDFSAIVTNRGQIHILYHGSLFVYDRSQAAVALIQEAGKENIELVSGNSHSLLLRKDQSLFVVDGNSLLPIAEKVKQIRSSGAKAFVLFQNGIIKRLDNITIREETINSQSIAMKEVDDMMIAVLEDHAETVRRAAPVFSKPVATNAVKMLISDQGDLKAALHSAEEIFLDTSSWIESPEPATSQK